MRLVIAQTSQVCLLATTLLSLLSPCDSQAFVPDTLWARTYGMGAANDVIELPDGGYAAAGNGWPDPNGNPRIRLLRTDALGVVIWDRTYGGNYGTATKVLPTESGGFLLIGYENLPFSRLARIFGIDTNGDSLWVKDYGDWLLFDARRASDGGLILAGIESGLGGATLLKKTNAAYDVVWSRTYSLGYNTDLRSLDFIPDGGFLLAGETRDEPGGNWDAFLIRTDANGNAVWDRRYGTANEYEGAFDAAVLPNGDFIFAGRGAGLWVVRTDAQGDTIWTRAYPDRYDGTAIRTSPEGGFLLAASRTGTGMTDLELLRLDSNGNQVCARSWLMPFQDYGAGLVPTSDDGWIVGGFTGYFCGVASCYPQKFWLLRTQSQSVSIGDGEPVVLPIALRISPNPLRGRARLEYDLPSDGDVDLRIFDVEGRVVATLVSARQVKGPHAVVWTPGNRSSGVYFCRLRRGPWSASRKLLVLD